MVPKSVVIFNDVAQAIKLNLLCRTDIVIVKKYQLSHTNQYQLYSNHSEANKIIFS